MGVPVTHCRRRTIRRLVLSGVAALILLVVGELSLSLFTTQLSLTVHGTSGEIVMDGGTTDVTVPVQPGARLHIEQPGPPQREYQIDRSDTTARNDRNPDQFKADQNTPWYRFMAWLRDEGSLSRWQDVRLIDLSDGHV